MMFIEAHAEEPYGSHNYGYGYSNVAQPLQRVSHIDSSSLYF